MIFSEHANPPSPSRPAVRLASSAARPAPVVWLLATGLALGSALLVFAAGARAQAPGPAPATAATATATAAPSDPRYTVAQIAQAFGFIDSNKDGKLSREEAAGFRGVARHFDEADLDRDGFLSREEFGNALGDKRR